MIPFEERMSKDLINGDSMLGVACKELVDKGLSLW
jgi:hypothetical protein